MSLVPNTPRRPFEVRGWHVLAGVSAFFAVIIAVDASFMVIAIRTFPGQVSVTPYEDGLLYNRRIAQLEAQERLGWRASAGAEPGQVALEFRDRDGRALRRTGGLGAAAAICALGRQAEAHGHDASADHQGGLAGGEDEDQGRGAHGRLRLQALRDPLLRQDRDPGIQHRKHQHDQQPGHQGDEGGGGERAHPADEQAAGRRDQGQGYEDRADRRQHPDRQGGGGDHASAGQEDDARSRGGSLGGGGLRARVALGVGAGDLAVGGACLAELGVGGLKAVDGARREAGAGVLHGRRDQGGDLHRRAVGDVEHQGLEGGPAGHQGKDRADLQRDARRVGEAHRPLREHQPVAHQRYIDGQEGGQRRLEHRRARCQGLVPALGIDARLAVHRGENAADQAVIDQGGAGAAHPASLLAELRRASPARPWRCRIMPHSALCGRVPP